MRQPGNREISSEHPEQMRGVIATNVPLQSAGLVSTDIQSPKAIFSMMILPFLPLWQKWLHLNLYVNAKFQICKIKKKKLT